MNAFDRFLTGDVKTVNWCFENRHFIERLNENGISREFIADMLMNEDPVEYGHLEDNKYEVIYPAPDSKDYKEIRVILACTNNSIDLISVMRNNHTTTKRQKKQYQSKKKKDFDKKYEKAHSRRKWK